MRISGLTINLRSCNVINSASNRYDNLLTQMSSGKKISKGHQDPVLATRAIQLENSLKSTEQYTKNSNDAKSMLDYTESLLTQVSDRLSRVKELTVQAATDTVNNESRQAIAKEIDQIIIELTSMANQQFNGKYIFSGTNTTTKPFELVGDPVTDVKYHGNGNSIKYNISENYGMETNIPGDRAFADTINELINIRDIITSGDVEKISTDALNAVDTSIDRTINLRTELGAKSNIVESTLERLETMKLEIKSSYSSLMDVNVSEKSVELAGVEVSYQASLSVVSKLYQMSILDYL